MNLIDRHPATVQILRWFDARHLAPQDAKPGMSPAGSPRLISELCGELAGAVIRDLPDSPELTAGLRKLLEAKDCFVRAAVAVED